jgi:FSR family fosmidomycin resistance protein-like MFS transporter
MTRRTAISAEPVADSGDAGQQQRLGSLAAMSWAHFLNDGAANYLPGILPAVLLGLNLPVALAGTVMGALLMGHALQPFYGWFADRIGGRSLIFIGIAGTTLGGGAVGIVSHYWSLITVLLLIGLTNSMFHPQALAGARRLAVARHGLYMSVFLVGGELGRGLWPLVGSLVVVNLGLGATWLLALPAVVTVPWLWRRVPRLEARHPDLPPIVWRRHLPDMVNVVSYSALRATLIFSVVTFVPLLSHAEGDSLVTGASMITTALVAGITGNIGGGHLADRFGRRRVLFVASGATALLLALYLVLSGPVIWLILALLGAALFATMPLIILLGQDILPENRSLGSGLALGLGNGIGAVVLTGLGWVAATWGSEAVLWLNVALGFVATVQTRFLPEPEFSNQ